MPPSENQLRALHDKMALASSKLAGVTERQMFGCDAFFADGVIYGLIWKKGRIGLKLPDVSMYDQLLELGDAEQWVAGTMKMGGWVLVPTHFHDEPGLLARWARQAHGLAVAGERVFRSKPIKAAKASSRRAASATPAAIAATSAAPRTKPSKTAKPARAK